MKTLLLTATYLVGIGELLLAIFFWVTHSKSEIRKVMAFLCLFTGAWVTCSAMVAYKTDTEIIDRLLFTFGAFLITSLLHLAIIFPYRIFTFDKLHSLLLYVPAVIFSAIAIFTNAISIGSIATPTTAGEVVPGPLYVVYNLTLATIFFIALGLFVYRYYKATGFHKQIVGRVIIGVTLGGLPAVFIDLLQHILFPEHTPNFLYGSILTSVWLGVIGYTVLKK